MKDFQEKENSQKKKEKSSFRNIKKKAIFQNGRKTKTNNGINIR